MVVTRAPRPSSRRCPRRVREGLEHGGDEAGGARPALSAAAARRGVLSIGLVVQPPTRSSDVECRTRRTGQGRRRRRSPIGLLVPRLKNDVQSQLAADHRRGRLSALLRIGRTSRLAGAANVPVDSMPSAQLVNGTIQGIEIRRTAGRRRAAATTRSASDGVSSSTDCQSSRADAVVSDKVADGTITGVERTGRLARFLWRSRTCMGWAARSESRAGTQCRVHARQVRSASPGLHRTRRTEINPACVPVHRATPS